jgi:hypothetical protein
MLAVCCALLWILSLLLPVAGKVGATEAVTDWLYGLDILLTGIFAYSAGQFGWWANFLIWFAIVGLLRAAPPALPRARVIGGLLLLLFVNSLFWTVMPEWNSADGWQPIGVFGEGYYLWMAAVFLAAAGVLARAFLADRRSNRAADPAEEPSREEGEG